MISSYKLTEDSASIEYKNLYSINGIIYFLTTEDVDLPSVKKFTISYDWKPAILKFKSEDDLLVYLNNLENIHSINLSVLADNLWYGNVGHGLFDVLYPIYLSLLKFGYKDEPFTFLSLDWSWRENMMYYVIKDFTKQDLIEYNSLDKDKVYHFKTLVAGTDLAGNRVVNKDMLIYGEQWDGLYNFKKRIFEINNITVDKEVNIDFPKIIIVNNKRFTDRDLNVINNVINRLSSICDIKFIDWYHDYKQFDKLAFVKQMEDFQNVDIQVTSPGTAMMYTPFLKKGAVNINLGYIEHTQTNGVRLNLKIKDTSKDDYLVPAYMEQSVCAGTYYITSLYYDRYKYNNLEIEPLINIIEQAIKILRAKKINKGNLNIDAQVFKEYCKIAKDSDAICSHLTSSSLQIEFFVNEHPHALLPSTDIELLRSIKDAMNYDRGYEIKL